MHEHTIPNKVESFGNSVIVTHTLSREQRKKRVDEIMSKFSNAMDLLMEEYKQELSSLTENILKSHF